MDSGQQWTSAVSRNSVASELRASGVEAAAAAAAMAAASRASGRVPRYSTGYPDAIHRAPTKFSTTDRVD